MAPTLTKKSTITLTHTYDGVVDLILPAPTLENIHSLELNRVFRATRQLTRKSYRYTNWPKIERFVYICEGCTQQQRDDFETFMDVSCGRAISLNDYESRVWGGVIDVVSPIKQQYRNCGFVLQFEFEGSL